MIKGFDEKNRSYAPKKGNKNDMCHVSEVLPVLGLKNTCVFYARKKRWLCVWKDMGE